MDKKDREENYIKNMIYKGRAITAMLNNRTDTKKNQKKIQIYNKMVKRALACGAETWKFDKNLESKLMTIKMNFLRRSARC